ncbi:MAG: hypothetical protein ABMB14_30025, partial [Myxococcota bacterium]
REALAGSAPDPTAQDALPDRLPTRVAGEALLARAEGRAADAARLFAELARHPLFRDILTDGDDHRARLAIALPL